MSRLAGGLHPDIVIFETTRRLQTLRLRGGDTAQEEKLRGGSSRKDSRRKNGKGHKRSTSASQDMRQRDHKRAGDTQVLHADNSVGGDSESEVLGSMEETLGRNEEPGAQEEGGAKKTSGPRLVFGVSCGCIL